MIPVPANIDIDDTIMCGLTARHLAVMAPVAAGLLWLWQWLDDVAPVWVVALVCVPPAVATAVVMLVRRDGTTADRLLWAAIRQPRRRLAPGAPDPHASLQPAGTREAVPGGLYGPVKAITDDGVLNLGRRGCAVAYDATCINLDLRSHAEQEALVAAFARTLHGVAAAVQIVISTQPVDLSGHAAAIDADSAHAPAALRDAAADHAAWLHDLTSHQVLLRRQITIVLHAADATVACRAGDHAQTLAAAFGVGLTRLHGDEVSARIRHGIDPYLHQGA